MKQKHKVRLYERCVLAGFIITAAAGYASEALLIAIGYIATDALIAVHRRGHPLAKPHDSIDEDVLSPPTDWEFDPHDKIRSYTGSVHRLTNRVYDVDTDTWLYVYETDTGHRWTQGKGSTESDFDLAEEDEPEP